MKRIALIACLAALLLLLCGRPGPACTMVMAAKNNVVLAGNNEDWSNPRTRVTFVPAAAGRYGYVYFGFDDGGPQGGMNDQGLFIDGNAVASSGWKVDANKRSLSSHPIHEVLGTCATVADARAFFEKTNVFALDRARFPVADRSGASMVVEHAQGEVRFIREPTWYQVSTNFLRTFYPGEEVPCNRFRLAMRIMAGADRLDLALIRAVLSATHQEGANPTVYSNICDLKAGTITLYLFHNFEEAVTLNLAEELKKGGRSVELPSLFRVLPHAAKVFAEKTAPPSVQASYPILLDLYNQQGAAAAVARYEQMRREVRWVSPYDIGEEQILRLAGQLLDKGDAKTSLAFCLPLSRSFPESARVHEAVARAQLALGNRLEAAAALRRVLEFDAKNAWAAETLGRLEKEK